MRKNSMPAALRLLRPWHYGKNLLVFVPLFFSGQMLARPDKLLMALLGFVCMCMTSSAIYVLNDLRDAPADRLHPQKCRRPIASGEVPPGRAAMLCAGLLLGACALLALGAWRAARPLYAPAVLGAYVALNVGYSVFGLKHVPIVDVTIVALGFVLRILLGAALTDVAVSRWLLLTVLMGSYYMALGKRRNELRDVRAQARPVLGAYTYEFLNQNMYVFLTLALAFYSLWSVDISTTQRHSHAYAVASVPLVVLIAMRYNLNIEGDSDGDPIEVILRDKGLIALAVVYALLMLVLIYL